MLVGVLNESYLKIRGRAAQDTQDKMVVDNRLMLAYLQRQAVVVEHERQMAQVLDPFAKVAE